MPICAQTYICLQKDVDAVAVSSDSHLKLYKNSTILVDEQLKVRVESITNDGNNNRDNKAGGFAEGVVFDVIKNDNEIKNVHYRDKVKERYDAPGVTISVNFMTNVDGKAYLIPYTDAKKVELNTPTLYVRVFKYDKTKSSLVYAPTATDQLQKGAKLVIDGTQLISNIEGNKPVTVHDGANIRLIRSSEGTYFLDEIFNTSDLEKISVTNPDDSKDDGTLYYIVGGVIALLLIICIGYFFMKFKRRPSNKDKNNHDKEVLEHIIQ